MRHAGGEQHVGTRGYVSGSGGGGQPRCLDARGSKLRGNDIGIQRSVTAGMKQGGGQPGGGHSNPKLQHSNRRATEECHPAPPPFLTLLGSVARTSARNRRVARGCPPPGRREPPHHSPPSPRHTTTTPMPAWGDRRPRGTARPEYRYVYRSVAQARAHIPGGSSPIVSQAPGTAQGVSALRVPIPSHSRGGVEQTGSGMAHPAMPTSSSSCSSQRSGGRRLAPPDLWQLTLIALPLGPSSPPQCLFPTPAPCKTWGPRTTNGWPR